MKRHPEKIKLCTGCESLYTEVSSDDDGHRAGIVNCRMTPEYEDKSCPCLICLVKMRCIIEDDECEAFMEYRRNIPVGLL